MHPWFLGNKAQRGTAKCIDTSVSVGKCVNILELLDSGSKITQISLITFIQVAQTTLSLGKLLQIETCIMSITSYS